MTKPTTILVIEDNDINREILGDILQEQYTMLFARDGKEGMEMLHEHYSDIDVVLLDIEMPVMDGYEVLEAKSKEELLKDIPVIVTTSGDDEVHCLKLGAHDFIRKPYDPVIVRLRIENIINLRESNEANRLKTLFIQNISHEIRTPMNAIMGFAQLLESMSEEAGSSQAEDGSALANALSPDDIKTFCRNITDNSYTLMSMIDNMLALSNFDCDSVTMKLSDASPNNLCHEAMKSASYCTQEGVKVCFTSNIDDSFVFKTNAKYLRQAIYNFIVNANKFTKEGEIHICCEKSDTAQESNCSTSSLSYNGPEKSSSLTIAVKDTGIGVPADKADYIFERFTKIDSFIPGMGLGLTIARKIAETLNGRAYLDTTYSQGARFVIELPLQG